jgi:hypothetical protein
MMHGQKNTKLQSVLFKSIFVLKRTSAMCAKINMLIFSDELNVYLLIRSQNYFKHKNTDVLTCRQVSVLFWTPKCMFTNILIIYISCKIMAALELLQWGSRFTIRKMKQTRYEKILANNQLEALFSCIYLFHVSTFSSVTALIIRRSKCINTSSGMISLCKWLLGMPARREQCDTWNM